MDLLAVGSDPPCRRHRDRVAGDQPGGGVTGLDEQADEVRRVLVPAASASGDEPSHGGIGLRCDLGVRLIAGCDRAHVPRRRPGQPERVGQRGQVITRARQGVGLHWRE
jgi:hypothetical protein